MQNILLFTNHWGSIHYLNGKESTRVRNRSRNEPSKERPQKKGGLKVAKLKIIEVNIIDNHNADVTLEDNSKVRRIGNWELEGKPPQIGDIVDTSKFLDPFTELTRKGLYDQRKKPHRSPWY